jgi:hypothetical protein
LWDRFKLGRTGGAARLEGDQSELETPCRHDKTATGPSPVS